MPIGVSDLATALVERKRDVADRAIPVYGVAVHCTGSGLITKALAHGADCLEYAIAYYLRPASYFAHYVVGFDGTIAQIADEHERAMHIGLPAGDRQAYLLGTWKKKLPARYVAAWTARWPQYKSPSHLYPGKSPNAAYVGIELLPWQAGCPGDTARTGAALHDRAARRDRGPGPRRRHALDIPRRLGAHRPPRLPRGHLAPHPHQQGRRLGPRRRPRPHLVRLGLLHRADLTRRSANPSP